MCELEMSVVKLGLGHVECARMKFRVSLCCISINLWGGSQI